MKSSAELCFTVLTLMPWCDTASIMLPPVTDAYIPAQIVAFHLQGGGAFWEIGHDSVYEHLCHHDTMNSNLACRSEKIFWSML